VTQQDDKLSRDGRRLALVSVVGAFTFIGIEAAGAVFGWSNQIMGLLELGIAAVFLWVFIQAFRMWRTRQSEKDG
jgi:threonine/homoserine/homoserine lactone efflux protein